MVSRDQKLSYNLLLLYTVFSSTIFYGIGYNPSLYITIIHHHLPHKDYLLIVNGRSAKICLGDFNFVYPTVI